MKFIFTTIATETNRFLSDFSTVNFTHFTSESVICKNVFSTEKHQIGFSALAFRYWLPFFGIVLKSWKHFNVILHRSGVIDILRKLTNQNKLMTVTLLIITLIYRQWHWLFMIWTLITIYYIFPTDINCKSQRPKQIIKYQTKLIRGTIIFRL